MVLTSAVLDRCGDLRDLLEASHVSLQFSKQPLSMGDIGLLKAGKIELWMSFLGSGSFNDCKISNCGCRSPSICVLKQNGASNSTGGFNNGETAIPSPNFVYGDVELSITECEFNKYEFLRST